MNLYQGTNTLVYINVVLAAQQFWDENIPISRVHPKIFEVETVKAAGLWCLFNQKNCD